MVRGGVSILRVEADWDDAEAAVSAALGKSELVKVRLERAGGSRLVYVLRTSRDEPAEFTITRGDRWGWADPVPLLLTCSIGRFGDPQREREFLALVAERLGQLRGVEVAPLG